ncbi:SAM-dependent methyltransferase, UbiE family [Teredinibacter turnerae T7901]|uniref:SAM-dependent methyltransferase, UbiE family n=1 Tax=Teredinibacter turnerae (strain ATCC 39867 / T7901) TaxID=377629 RepID=C5BME8_TERTT|nr:class I SAM-dependent methyltransferase [Teredinibacter turnerae]ACR12849.1 SAM-dependent methyltransferase, UbiE family [Teredinibacter turnerae T7901]
MLTIRPEKLPLKPGDCVLDLGCGEGRHTLGLYFSAPLGELSGQLSLIGIDISAIDLATANKRKTDFPLPESQRAGIQFVRGDGLKLPLPDASVDHLICSEVLEHIPDYHAMLREINRVLKPGGTLCVSVPRAWPERICWWLEPRYHQVAGGHIRIFNRASLKRDLRSHGIQLFFEHGAHALHAPYWWLKCLFWDRGDRFWPVQVYHRFLVWDLFRAPWLTRSLDKLLNPLLGKSIVIYGVKGPGAQ